ncbi:MAG: glycosyltransferase [Planctomycetota bacterium]
MTPPGRPVVAHVLHRLAFAGAEVLARDLARQLGPPEEAPALADPSSDHSDPIRGRGFDFVFLCLDDAGPMSPLIRDDGFPVVPLHRKPGIDLPLAARIAAALAHHRVDLVHAHQYTPFFYTSVARRLRPFRSHPPVLFTEHGRHYPDTRKLKRVLANRLLLRPDDRVTAVGQFVRHALHDNEGIPRHRVQVIHNGIDPARFDPGPLGSAQRAAARAAARQAFQHIAAESNKPADLTDATPVVLQVARFHPVKDHATAIHAFALMHDRLPDARLVLVGDGDDRPTLEQAAWDQGVADHTLFAGVRDDVHALMPGADVFLLSSLSEGISVTLLEAMAAALPVVATDVGGNPEVVAHGHTGLLAPRRDAAALADHLHRLLTSTDLRHTLAAQAPARCRDKFHQTRMHREYDTLYHAMLNNPQPN